MALLKSLIQWLLDSRTTPAQAAHSALRNTSSSTSIFTGEQIYTAPEDGFITVEGKSEANGGSAIGISSNGENYFLRTFQSVKDWGQAVTAPVSKGETVSISLYNLTDIEVKFYKSFGGGYNILVRRALSCLRPSFNFSLKNSLLAEATGFPTNPIQLFKRRISHLQRQENGFLSSLLATGGSASKGLPRKFCLATGRFGRGAIQQRHLIKAFVFLSQKAGLWPTYYRQTPRAHMSSLFRVSAINSFQTGGALC